MLFVQYVINGEINDKYVATQPVDIHDYSSIFGNETAFECIGLDSDSNK